MAIITITLFALGTSYGIQYRQTDLPKRQKGQRAHRPQARSRRAYQQRHMRATRSGRSRGRHQKSQRYAGPRPQARHTTMQRTQPRVIHPRHKRTSSRYATRSRSGKYSQARKYTGRTPARSKVYTQRNSRSTSRTHTQRPTRRSIHTPQHQTTRTMTRRSIHDKRGEISRTAVRGPRGQIARTQIRGPRGAITKTTARAKHCGQITAISKRKTYPGTSSRKQQRKGFAQKPKTKYKAPKKPGWKKIGSRPGAKPSGRGGPGRSWGQRKRWKRKLRRFGRQLGWQLGWSRPRWRGVGAWGWRRPGWRWANRRWRWRTRPWSRWRRGWWLNAPITTWAWSYRPRHSYIAYHEALGQYLQDRMGFPFWEIINKTGDDITVISEDPNDPGLTIDRDQKYSSEVWHSNNYNFRVITRNGLSKVFYNIHDHFIEIYIDEFGEPQIETWNER